MINSSSIGPITAILEANESPGHSVNIQLHQPKWVTETFFIITLFMATCLHFSLLEWKANNGSRRHVTINNDFVARAKMTEQ